MQASDYLSIKETKVGQEIWFDFAAAEEAIGVRNGKKINTQKICTIEREADGSYVADANADGDYIPFPTIEAALSAALTYATDHVNSLPLRS